MTNDSTLRVSGSIVLVVLAACPGGAGGPPRDGGTAAADGADAAPGGESDGDGASADWCVWGQTSRFTNPETGERVSMEVEGVVSYEGRQACEAVWEANRGGVRRVEMYFTEDRSYHVMVTYDAEWNVVNEVQMGGSSG